MTGVEAWVLGAEQALDERCLSVEEQRHAADHRSRAAARRHRRGRALLRHAVAQRLGGSPDTVPLRTPTDRGPARLEGPTHLAVSVAHSADVVAVAVGDYGPVGIDVEVAAARSRPVPRRVLTPARLAAVADLVDPVDLGLRELAVWVVLEAALKAAGTGFAQPHGRATFTGAAGGVLVELPVGGVHGCRVRRVRDRVLVAVATPAGVPDVRWHTHVPRGQGLDVVDASCSSRAAAYASAGSSASGAPSSPVTVVTQR